MSLAPASRREVLIAGRSVPDHAAHTRLRHARELAGSRRYIWRFAIVGGVVFLLASVTGRPVIAASALVVALLVVAATLLREATERAHRDFFAGFALTRGLSYSERRVLGGDTPLLAAGDRRRCEHFMEGQVKSKIALDIGLGHYVYETREQRRSRHNRTINVYSPHWMTICVAQLPRAAGPIPGVYLARRERLLGGGGWFDRPGLQTTELVGRKLPRGYQLLTRSDQDRELVDEMLEPAFLTWLAELPLPVYFEFEAGVLVAYTPRKLRAQESLLALLGATERIAAQINDYGEPLQALSRSMPPPVGDTGFGPPPPATKPHVEPVPVAVAPSRVGAGSVPPPAQPVSRY